MSTVNGVAPANWYPDPSGLPRLRYWDGANWTEHYHQADPAHADPAHANPAQAQPVAQPAVQRQQPLDQMAAQQQAFAQPSSSPAPAAGPPSGIDFGFTDHMSGTSQGFSSRPEDFEAPPEDAIPRAKARRASMNPFVHWANATLRRPFDFGGRSRRAEYWFTTLADLIIYFAFGALAAALGADDELASIPVVFLGGYALLVAISRLALQTRRLHDTSRSARWIAVMFVPFIGGFVMLYFMAIDGDRFSNLYGESPKYVQPPKQRARWY